MNQLYKKVVPLLVAASTVIGCGKGREHSIRIIGNVDDIRRECKTAVINSDKFDKSERTIVCDKYLSGKMAKGGIVWSKDILCDDIVTMTRIEAEELLNDKICYAPNVSGWPQNNLGPEH